MTDRPAARPADDGIGTDLVDPAAKDPAEGARDDVADLPSADTGTADDPAREDDQDQP